jgi:hypothetical protein
LKKEEFDELLKKLGISRQEFATMTDLAYSTISNWSDDKKPIPGWVDSWLENYIKAKSYEDIKKKVIEIEKLEKILMMVEKGELLK